MPNTINSLEKKIEDVFDKKFSDFWIDALSHNIFRTRELVLRIGNINDALIIQAISWHHYLLSIHESKQISDSSFNSALEMWNEKQASNKKKLTISNISDLTAIPFETTRRHISKLEKKGWLFYNKSDGVVLNVNSDINNIIVNQIHPYEKKLIKKFILNYLKAHLEIK